MPRPDLARPLVLGFVLFSSISGAPRADAQVPLDDPIPVAIPQSRARVTLDAVAFGLDAPVWATSAPGLRNHLFVVDQSGKLISLDLRTRAASVVLDVSSLLVPLGALGPGSYDERGFLGVAFDPGFAHNARLYTYTSRPPDIPADFSTLPPGVTPNCVNVVSEWRSTDPRDPVAPIDPASERVLLAIAKPQFNHNAGAVVFGPDRMLYVSTGDGGGADDEDGQPFIGGPVVGHGSTGNGQNLANPLGKILRIDPRGSNAANGRYGVPADNPFVGVPGALPEIWAYGLRNPFRISFDRKLGELWIGDVGQNDVEEVDIGQAGANYGWRHKEGSFFFVPNGTGNGFVTDVDPGVPGGLVDPIAEYDHDEGIAIVGGFVYRGRRNAELRGRYVFGDFSRTFSLDGRLFALERGGPIEELRLHGRPALGAFVLGLGEDARGELYLLVNRSAAPFGSTGEVLHIGAAPIEHGFAARLSGGEEVPPVDGSSTLFARFALSEGGEALRFLVGGRRRPDASAMRIQLGGFGETGPTVVSLPPPPSVGAIRAADLEGPLAGRRLADLIAVLENAGAYLNLTTVANPEGEARGQILSRREVFSAELVGGEEVPPVVSNASVRLQLERKGDGSALRYEIGSDGLAGALTAQLRLGAQGQEGPIVAELAPPPARGELRAADLEGPLAGHALTHLLAELFAGNVYANVATAANPEGEVRGQIR